MGATVAIAAAGGPADASDGPSKERAGVVVSDIAIGVKLASLASSQPPSLREDINEAPRPPLQLEEHQPPLRAEARFSEPAAGMANARPSLKRAPTERFHDEEAFPVGQRQLQFVAEAERIELEPVDTGAGSDADEDSLDSEDAESDEGSPQSFRVRSLEKSRSNRSLGSSGSKHSPSDRSLEQKPVSRSRSTELLIDSGATTSKRTSKDKSDTCCVNGCGRKPRPSKKPQKYAACCKVCYLYHQKKGAVAHDVKCEVKYNDGLDFPFYWRSKGMLTLTQDIHIEVGKQGEGFHGNDLIHQEKQADHLLSDTLPGYDVVQCVRIEDSKLWRTYADRRAEIRKRGVKKHNALQVDTSKRLGSALGTTRDQSVNEVFVFHGTTQVAANIITRSGFRLPTTDKGRYGKGLYFSDSASKSHQYVGASHTGLVMLLCRVILGSPKAIDDQEDKEAYRLVVDNPNVDSLYAHVEGNAREFVVFDLRQVYPEFVVLYRSWLPDKK